MLATTSSLVACRCKPVRPQRSSDKTLSAGEKPQACTALSCQGPCKQWARKWYMEQTCQRGNPGSSAQCASPTHPSIALSCHCHSSLESTRGRWRGIESELPVRTVAQALIGCLPAPYNRSAFIALRLQSGHSLCCAGSSACISALPSRADRAQAICAIAVGPATEQSGLAARRLRGSAEGQSPATIYYTGSATEFKATNLSPGTRHIFEVQARSDAGSSGWSEPASIALRLLPPEPPSDVCVEVDDRSISGPAGWV